jgi:hypothetical protein
VKPGIPLTLAVPTHRLASASPCSWGTGTQGAVVRRGTQLRPAPVHRSRGLAVQAGHHASDAYDFRSPLCLNRCLSHPRQHAHSSFVFCIASPGAGRGAPMRSLTQTPSGPARLQVHSCWPVTASASRCAVVWAREGHRPGPADVDAATCRHVGAVHCWVQPRVVGVCTLTLVPSGFMTECRGLEPG